VTPLFICKPLTAAANVVCAASWLGDLH